MLYQWCRELAALPEPVWSAYARSREPLARLVSPEEYLAHYRAACTCGVETARQARQRFGPCSCPELAERLGLTVSYPPMPPGDGLLTFACFHEPDRIEVFTDNADATQDLIRQCGGEEFLGAVDLRQMLLAHELAHFLQLRDPSLYIHRKLVRLRPLGPIRRSSRLVSLEEVAAMAFARQWLGLAVEPYLYDVLMLLPQAPMQAKELYRHLMELKEEHAHE